jgi:membrane protein implicated in regulation of membrane protease activity
MTMGTWEWAHLIIGALASLIFLIQSLGSAGSGDESGADFDAGATDTSLMDYLSVRNFVAFFIGYGWVTLAALLSGFSKVSASVGGTAAGAVFVLVSLFLLRSFVKFQEDGSLKPETLVGKHASVYIVIGAEASGMGKVMVDTKTGRIELPARTRDPKPLRPGTLVRILEAEDSILWVTGEK